MFPTKLRNTIWKSNFKAMQREFSSNPDYKVQHEPTQQKFSISLPENDEAYLKYKEVEPKVLDYYSTFVPPNYRGKQPSLASLLASSAMEYALSNNIKVKLSCEYLEKKYKNDSKYKNNIIDESKL